MTAQPISSLNCGHGAILFRRSAALHLDFQLRTLGGALLTDCRQIHLLKLPKYHPKTDNGVIEDPIRQWIHFFRFAATSDTKELQDRLPDPVERGEARGEAIGRVRVLQSLAGDSESTFEDLRSFSVDERPAMETDLKRRLRERGS